MRSFVTCCSHVLFCVLREAIALSLPIGIPVADLTPSVATLEIDLQEHRRRSDGAILLAGGPLGIAGDTETTQIPHFEVWFVDAKNAKARVLERPVFEAGDRLEVGQMGVLPHPSHIV